MSIFEGWGGLTSPRMIINFDGEGDGDAGGSGEAGGGGAGDGSGDGSGDGGQGDGGKPAPGSFTLEKWHDALPEQVRTDNASTLEKYPSLDGAIVALTAAQKKLGAIGDPDSILTMPKADDAEGFRAVMTKLGLPEDVKGYELKPIENGADFLTPDKPVGQALIASAHKHGILPAQAQALYSDLAGVLNDQYATTQKEIDATHTQNIETLEAEFGEAKDEKFAAADWAAMELGGQELKDKLEKANLATDPVVIKALVKAATWASEENLGEGSELPGGDKKTVSQVKEQARDLQRQALGEKNPAERRRLNEEAQKLWKSVAPGNVPD